MAKTAGDLRELVKVMLERSNAKEKTKIPDESSARVGMGLSWDS